MFFESCLTVLEAGSALAPVCQDGQLIAALDVLQEDPGVDWIIVSGHGLGHVEVPSRATVPKATSKLLAGYLKMQIQPIRLTFVNL